MNFGEAFNTQKIKISSHIVRLPVWEGVDETRNLQPFQQGAFAAYNQQWHVNSNRTSQAINNWTNGAIRGVGTYSNPMTDGGETKLESAWPGAWQSNVLDHAWSALRDIERKNPGAAVHTLLIWRTEFPEETSEQLAARLTEKLGTPVRPVAGRQMLRRARLRFADLLVKEIALGLDDATPQEIEEELAALGLLEHVRDFLPSGWKERGKLIPDSACS